MVMKSVSAHFDGKHIQLDESVAIEPDAKLIVTILTNGNSANEDEDWYALSAQSLAAAYDENEPEYSTDSLKEVNPEYEGW